MLAPESAKQIYDSHSQRGDAEYATDDSTGNSSASIVMRPTGTGSGRRACCRALCARPSVAFGDRF